MPASQTLTRARAEPKEIKLPILISFTFMPLYMSAAMASIATSRDRVRQFTVIIEASNFQMFLFGGVYARLGHRRRIRVCQELLSQCIVGAAWRKLDQPHDATAGGIPRHRAASKNDSLIFLDLSQDEDTSPSAFL